MLALVLLPATCIDPRDEHAGSAQPPPDPDQVRRVGEWLRWSGD